MEIRPEQVLSHFRVVEKVGEGGMGVVYRAKDLHLQRDVALKVISPRAISAPNAEERFRKEALALSRLNHPNIAAIYDFDSQDGVTFLVMEWIPGVNLDVRLLQGPLSQTEVLEIGDQIASGLAYAHATGVVHRDLKPANLRIATDGRVKMLDFGLAKLLTPISDTAITDTLPRTLAVVGTLPYIAPELLSGQRAGPASDVYAFGAVLYELATGRRAFPQGDSDALMQAILNESPRPPHELRRDLSPDVEHVILKSLEKRPERRYQSAAEIRADLNRISSGLPLVIRPQRWQRSEIVKWAFAIPVAALIVILLGLVWTKEPSRGVPVMKALVTWPSEERSSRISPDGQWISFMSNRDGRDGLWLQRIRGGHATLVTEQSGMISQTWSPDGEKLAVLLPRGDKPFVQVLPAFGGPAATSRRLPHDFLNADLVRWLGSRLYIEVIGQALWRLDMSTGALEQVVSAKDPEGLRHKFDVRQDEKQIAFQIRKGDRLAIWLSDVSGGRPVPMTTGAYNDYLPRFAGAAGEHLFFSSDRGGQVDLWRFDVAKGEAEQITFSPAAEYVDDVSPDLSLLSFREDHQSAHLWILERGQHRQLTADTLRDSWPSVSRDRSAILLQRQKPRIEGLPFFDGQILLANLADVRSSTSWIPVADGVVGRLSPDGKRLAYVRATAPQRYQLWTKDLETSHEWLVTDRFDSPRYYPFPFDWTRSNLAWSDDGRTLFFNALEDKDRETIRSSDGEGPARVLVSSPPDVALHDLQLSPDGKSLGYVQTRGGGDAERVSEVRVYETVSGLDRPVYSVTHGRRNHLFFRGWSSRGGMVLLKSVLNPDWTQNAAVLEVLASRARAVAELDRTFAGAARLDPHRDLLYFVRRGEDLVHNLFSLSLPDAKVRQLSNNSIPGISFSGLEVAPDGSLLYVRQEMNQDIWTIQFPR